MKDYQKPELEIVNLVAQEKITISDPSIDVGDGNLGLSNSIFG